MTQAVNLANFANNLDSSGGVSPNALNAPTPISKGGTGASTAAGAATALAAAFGNLLFPVGSIYTNASDGTNPATLLGFGTWTSLGAGRMLVGYSSGDPLFGTAGNTGGSRDAITVAHTHTISGTTGADGSHFHTVPGYQLDTLSGGGISRYTVNTGGTVNTSTIGTHTHTFSGTTASTGASGTNANLPPYLTVYMWQRVS